ncbi:MAG: 1-deoxy-D-xylulose-5-phosphate reductoisomerase [Deltaproteobacteria bacterium]|nr:1-deoxy-D-xylulose-5-phosphate reductoisomerase [Deltaproteobacteria bacterium]
MTKRISILGSTGSIGLSTVDLVLRHPDRFQVVGLAAGSNLKVLCGQIQKLKPKIVSVKSEGEAGELRNLVGRNTVEIVHGVEGASLVASHPEADMVISAIVGAAGLLPTLKAIQQGKTVGLANKESMVIAGELMRREAVKKNVTILPVDSEHSALFQCLEGQRREDVERLILTASGGPFLHKPASEFGQITVKEALNHPNWKMGAKITVDSATMMNKGLEVMEARWLFDLPVDKIDICVHPQSIVHSMVEYIDGSVMAQMGLPDMKVPIAYALSYPERIETGVPRLDLFQKRELTFYPPDFEKFTCLKTAYEVARRGKTSPAVLNAANEEAVAAFLADKIKFTDIPRLIDKTIQAHQPFEVKSLEDVLEADRWARERTKFQISNSKSQTK